ncbi:MAG: response regulator [Stappia sp.]|uniref:response regulator transcription factor n=1 Tax=Stappia sp. TaxID=1870903 RepID=UPI000C5945C3|nr:response regulator [Stappia sp.]MAA99534.1 response regulator [Stappia sp.]MBM20146.1 response regulator [Stappia sp.]|tara:strand:- start:1197 stop:1607 length:411 start_codon:yes stop_codon:yes gene_type:complete
MTANVLIVDDEAALAGFLKEVIEADGYAVHLAASLEEAHRRLAEARPDVMLVDAALPDGNGYALCQDVRGRSETARLPLVFMSAMSRPVDIEKALALGADAFLGKPFLAGDLTRTLARLTGRDTMTGRDAVARLDA